MKNIQRKSNRVSKNPKLNIPDPSDLNKSKYYTVWKGRKVGVFSSWKECKESVDGFKDAKYKSFKSYDSAIDALLKNNQRINNSKKNKPVKGLSVDASCLGNPGLMEYQGVDVKTKKVIFRVSGFDHSTNNIGEFLALVHGLSHLKNIKSNQVLYTDSVTAISWVKNKKCNTSLNNNNLNSRTFELITRAEKWLRENKYENEILKWETKSWGEIPADFGRK